MHKQDVERLLDFIHKRQEAEGPASAFKFSNILVGNEQVPSRYSSCHGTEKVNDAHTKKKRASYKAKARTDTLPPSIPIEHFDQPVPDVVEITNMGQSGGVGDFTEVGDEERNEMVKTGLDKAHLEHMGWLAGGVPRFRVKKNIWMTYKQFTAGGASVQEMPAIDPALYQQGRSFSIGREVTYEFGRHPSATKLGSCGSKDIAISYKHGNGIPTTHTAHEIPGSDRPTSSAG
jgi:hypothetical protein